MPMSHTFEGGGGRLRLSRCARSTVPTSLPPAGESRLAVVRALRAQIYCADGALLFTNESGDWRIRGVPREFQPNVVAGTWEYYRIRGRTCSSTVRAGDS